MAVDPKSLNDPMKLRTLMENAARLGRGDLALACQMRIAELAGLEHADIVEREFWQAVAIAEEFVSRARGKTVRLSRTRQKEKRVGARQCLEDWALAPGTTDGFRMLLDAGHPELTGEAIVLRHPEEFGQDVIESARRKLVEHGVDLSRLRIDR